MKFFLEGYYAENNLDPAWLKCIPDFLKLREYDLYGILQNENPADFNDWCHRFLKGRRKRLEHNNPVIDIDFLDFL